MLYYYYLLCVRSRSRVVAAELTQPFVFPSGLFEQGVYVETLLTLLGNDEYQCVLCVRAGYSLCWFRSDIAAATCDVEQMWEKL